MVLEDEDLLDAVVLVGLQQPALVQPFDVAVEEGLGQLGQPLDHGDLEAGQASINDLFHAVRAAVESLPPEARLVLTLRGLVTYYVLFFIPLESRRVVIGGITVVGQQPVAGAPGYRGA